MSDTGVVCIRLLRDAELRGRDIIAAARQRRVKRVKEAKISAQAEVDEFKKECEATFASKCEQVSVVETARSKEINDVVKRELGRMEMRVKACSPYVVDLLEKLVCHQEPQVHHNFILRRQIEATDSYSPVKFSCDKYVGSLVTGCVQKCEMTAANLKLDDLNNNTESFA